MKQEGPDELIERNLFELFRKRLPGLGDRAIREALVEILESRWRELAAKSYHESRSETPNPTENDAMRAFDAMRFLLEGDVILLELSLGGVWRNLKTAPVKRWPWKHLLSVFAISASMISGVFGIGYLLGLRADQDAGRPAAVEHQ